MSKPPERPDRGTPAALRRAGPPRRPNSQLLPTLFDRLRDDAPHRRTEAPEEYTVTRTQMRKIIQRDLTYLLNTTNREDEIDRARYPQAASSTLNYGVPALAGSYLPERKWDDIIRIVQRAIEDFEPRLIPGSLGIAPMLKEDAPHRHNVLLFEISGLIHMDPYPMAFTAQSSLDLETSRMQVKSIHAN
ncbi:type VI secretion system baseplate subunit TssE [Cupriavidus sp. IK-TO18]|uniref:type VI secretion system baseplate subunit TssE n=1 Tax=Cupriavidus sp. IK-TO18 TaxID=2782182 RepID=UPI00189A062C|nr:type VI secretion system baseplate subunit TssE [Cupriavidus sp. IK-TO18]MBF6988522.1 type VI secretion system baseplate subunit TssE [Cupriavidus sp. IK-TO18]